MLERNFPKLITVILIVAAILRLSVLLFGVNLPVMWDARRYVGAALALISHVDNTCPEASAEPEADRAAFDFYYQKYIQGEKIDWLYYRPLRLQEARDDIFFSGPLYPAALAILFAISPAADFTVARVFGIGGDILALWLLIVIAVRLVGRRAALIAGLLYAVYFPFVLTSTSLLLEPSTSLLLLATIYLLIRAVETDRRRFLVWAGLLLGLLVLNKPTAMLLGAPAVVGLYFYSSKVWDGRKFILRALLMILPLVVIVLGWFAVASIKYGQPALRDPNYSGANIRQSSSLKFEGYDLDQVGADFWERRPYGDLARRPADYLGLFAKKFERLFSRPYNDFERRLVLPLAGQDLMHLTIILFGLIGLLYLLLRDLTRGIWPLAIAVYYTGIHLIYHSINRYSYNALPLIIVCAAGMLVVLWDQVSSEDSRERRRAWLTLGALAAACLIRPGVLDLVHLPVTAMTVWMIVLLRLAFLGVAGFLVLSRTTGRLPLFRYGAAAMFVAICGTVVWSQWLSRDAWAEFDSALTDPAQKSGTRIFCGNLPAPEPGEKFFLALDIDIPTKLDAGYRLSINGSESILAAGYSDPSDFFFPKRQVYQAYARLMNRSLGWFRQYRLKELSADAVRANLAGLGYIDISLSLPEDTPAGQALNLHGVRGYDRSSAFIPSPEAADASIERWVHRRDARIRIPVDFLSDSTISYYIEGNETDLSKGQDLSPDFGRQTGRFNIYLVRVNRDSEYEAY